MTRFPHGGTPEAIDGLADSAQNRAGGNISADHAALVMQLVFRERGVEKLRFNKLKVSLIHD